MSGRMWMSKWLRFCAGSLALAWFVAPEINAEDERRSEERRVTPESLEHVGGVVNEELSDVARALRSLDQSYTFRGVRGRGAATAGSVFVDWDSKGVPEEKRYRVLPPEPLILSRPKGECVKRKPLRPAVEAAEPTPLKPQRCPCEGKKPACPCQTPRPDCLCGGQATPTRSRPLPAPSACAECEQRFPAAFPAPIYRHGSGGYGCGTAGCGGKMPPGAVLVNGQWTEATAGRGVTQTGGYYSSPQAPVYYGSPVW